MHQLSRVASIITVASLALGAGGVSHTALAQGTARGKAFSISSTDVKRGGRFGNTQVYGGFGCTGKNVSPALSWSGAPAGTKSFALTIYDPDAPTGSGWWHWMVYNIPATATSLPAGAGDEKGTGLPAGAVQGPTDFGAHMYGGPCPPAGDKPHRYIITIYALKTDKLDIPASATSAFVGFNIHGAQLAKASLVARYGR